MNAKRRWMCKVLILAVGAIGLAFTVRMSAQVQTTTEEKEGETTQKVTVHRAEVLAVEGNDLFVKMEDGSIRHIADVPETARVTVDGQEIGIHDVKPGMRLERTIVTTTTPKVIVTTQTVTGKVWQVTPPTSVILTLENGQNQEFKIPKGQKFMVDGQATDAFGLRKGMLVSATKVVEVPVTEVEQQAKLTGQMPPPPPAPPAGEPILIAVVVQAPQEPAPAPAPAPAVAELPQTASELPLMGLLGLMLMAGSLGVHVFRKVIA